MTQFKMVFPTQNEKEHLAQYRKLKSIITQLIKTEIPENPKNNISFSIWKPFWSYYMEGLGKLSWDLEISNSASKKEANFSFNAQS